MIITKEQFDKLPDNLKEYFNLGGAQSMDGCLRSNEETARKYGANSAIRKNIHPT